MALDVEQVGKLEFPAAKMRRVSPWQWHPLVFLSPHRDALFLYFGCTSVSDLCTFPGNSRPPHGEPLSLECILRIVASG